MQRPNRRRNGLRDALSDALGLILFPHEKKGLRLLGQGGQQAGQQIQLGAEVVCSIAGLDHCLHRGALRRGFDPSRPEQKLSSHGLRLGRIGRGEEEVLSFGGQDLQQFAELRHEAEVHHPVRFIQNQVGNRPGLERLTQIQFHEPSRRGHDQVTPFFEPGLLGTVTHPAIDDLDPQIRSCGQPFGHFGNLQSQLLGRSENDTSWPFALCVGQHGHEREQEGQGLARSCLGDANHILAGPDSGNGLALDFRGFGDPHVLERIEVLTGHLEVGKGHSGLDWVNQGGQSNPMKLGLRSFGL